RRNQRRNGSEERCARPPRPAPRAYLRGARLHRGVEAPRATRWEDHLVDAAGSPVGPGYRTVRVQSLPPRARWVCIAAQHALTRRERRVGIAVAGATGRVTAPCLAQASGVPAAYEAFQSTPRVPPRLGARQIGTGRDT